jgi:hypothetical protein
MEHDSCSIHLTLAVIMIVYSRGHNTKKAGCRAPHAAFVIKPIVMMGCAEPVTLMICSGIMHSIASSQGASCILLHAVMGHHAFCCNLQSILQT